LNGRDVRTEVTQLVNRKNIRSADKANLRFMLAKLRHGASLTYTERLNLTAYLDRYRDTSTEADTW